MVPNRFLLLIEKSNLLIPVAEKLANYECGPVYSIASDNFDALADLKTDKEFIEKICSDFGISRKNVFGVKTELYKKPTPRQEYVVFKIKMKGKFFKPLQDYTKQQDKIDKIYICTDNTLFIHLNINSLCEASNFEDMFYENLGEYIDRRMKRSVTYSVLKEFKKSSIGPTIAEAGALA